MRSCHPFISRFTLTVTGPCRFVFPILVVLLCSTTVFSQKQFNALLLTKTAAFQHASIPDGVAAMKTIAKKHHFELDWQENTGRFNDDFLGQYDVIIFLNTSGTILNDDQKRAFQNFIQSGKGFVGIHAASDTERDWDWYNSLVGRKFQAHPPEQTAMLDVANREFPGMEIFPDRFLYTEEWYEYTPEKYSEELVFLLKIDQNTYEPVSRDEDTTGKEVQGHPISWYQQFEGGRSFYTALGHLPAVYEDPWFLHHVYGGIYWAATGKGISTAAGEQ